MELPDPAQLERAVRAIDGVQRGDPVRVHRDGKEVGRELLLAERATHWLLALDPDADAAQQVAVRAHHLERWLLSRASYPKGRSGYLRWRREQQHRQAAAIAAILEDQGWHEPVIGEVQRLIRKDGHDDRAQAHEDAVCLAFLEVELDELLDRVGPDTGAAVLRKTAAKMSARALVLAGDVVRTGPGAALLRHALAAE